MFQSIHLWFYDLFRWQYGPCVACVRRLLAIQVHVTLQSDSDISILLMYKFLIKSRTESKGEKYFRSKIRILCGLIFEWRTRNSYAWSTVSLVMWAFHEETHSNHFRFRGKCVRKLKGEKKRNTDLSGNNGGAYSFRKTRKILIMMRRSVPTAQWSNWVPSNLSESHSVWPNPVSARSRFAQSLEQLEWLASYDLAASFRTFRRLQWILYRQLLSTRYLFLNNLWKVKI